MSGVTTVETVPTLALSGPLPGLPTLVPPSAAKLAPVREAVAAWTASWDDEEGEAERARARAVVARHLHGELDARGIEEALRPLVWMETEVGDPGLLPPVLAAPLERARELTSESGEARRNGDLRAALEKGLAAADLYRSVTPEAVARRMVSRAERRVDQAAEAEALEAPAEGTSPSSSSVSGGAPDDEVAPQVDDPRAPQGSPDEASLERARHLADGARRALDDGEHALAIQRAFYAIQVLDGRMVDPEL